MPQTIATSAARDVHAPEAAGRLIALVHAVEGCSHALRGAIEGLAAGHDLNTTQLTVLWACGEAPDGIGQSKLAGRIAVSAAQASALVEQLRRRDLLEARRATDDRRRQHWRLTATGRQVVAAVADGLAVLAQRVDECLADDQAAVGRTKELTHRLSTLAEAIERSQSPSADNAFPRVCRVDHHERHLDERIDARSSASRHLPQEARR